MFPNSKKHTDVYQMYVDVYHQYQGCKRIVRLVQKYEKVCAGVRGWLSCLFKSIPTYLLIKNVWNLCAYLDVLFNFTMW